MLRYAIAYLTALHRFTATATRSIVRAPERAQLYHHDLKTMIVTIVEDLYQLSLTAADNERKMRLLALERQARLALERHRKRDLSRQD